VYRADVLTGATSRPPNPNIRRGLFRLWLVLSVLWLIGVGFVYRPPACRYTPPDSSVRAVGPHDLRQCIGFIYERAVLHSIPARLTAGQEGLQWGDLTKAQQTFTIYSWRTPEGVLSPAQAEKRYGLALYDGVNPPTGLTPITRDGFSGDAQTDEGSGDASQSGPWTKLWNKIKRAEEAKAHPENFRYRMIPIPHSYADDFREELLGFLMVTLGTPLAVGCAGLLSVKVGHWVCSGFSRSR
jgi:hypothetical protein